MQWDVGNIISAAAVFLFLSVCSVSDFRSQTVSLRWVSIWMAVGIGMDICKICSGNLTITGLLCAVIPGAFLLFLSCLSGASGIGDGLAWLVIGFLYGSKDCWGAFAASLFLAFVWSGGLLIAKRAGRKKRLPFLTFSFVGTLLWMTAAALEIFASA